MEENNDFWIDTILVNKPTISDDGFSERVANKLNERQSIKDKRRSLILAANTIISATLLIFITPWYWLADKLNEMWMSVETEFAVTNLMQLPILGLSAAFILFITIYFDRTGSQLINIRCVSYIFWFF